MASNKIIIKGAKEHNLKILTLKYRETSLWYLRVFRVPESHRLRLTQFMPRVSADTLNHFLHMRVCFWGRWKNRMSII